MMGRMTLREVREALAAAKARGTKAPPTAPTVEELESLARILEREAEAAAPAEEPRPEGRPNKVLPRTAGAGAVLGARHDPAAPAAELSRSSEEGFRGG
jgi:hypothetical protein